ncbi:p3 protein [Caerostris darwini]|uniref:P3 protein n=1 Tax=Caerostris darwini TaxID=1538125 RepID=A0AAV4NAF2_9ARAC|nr:p3 protein [Caerostris darwini]
MAFRTVVYLFMCLICVNKVIGNNIPSQDLIPTVKFYPSELLGVQENEERDVLFEINWQNDTNITTAYSTGYTNIKVNLKATSKGCRIEKQKELSSANEESSKDFDLSVSVIRPPSILVNSVTGVFAALVAFNFINMGVQLDIESIKQCLRRPIGPAIGFFCQFLFMPLASYGISYVLFSDDSLRLGLFTLGCSPGGSMSNFWTLLFNGDVNLSITMTFISTVAALGMMPLWIFTLGASLFRDNEATIPYLNMAGSLVLLTFPIVIGLIIKRYSPKLTRISMKIIKPFTIFCVLFGITLASYVNRFVFYLFTWRVVVAGLSIAWGGYCFGALVSWLFRLERAQIIAISIETAFQNPAVAFVLLLLTLPQPGADLSSVPVVAQLMLTGIPMWILLIYTRIRRKITSSRESRRSTGQIADPKIDTVQKTYFAVETNPPEDRESVHYDPKLKKLDILARYSSPNQY